MNRFVWDLRAEGPATFPGMILWAANTRGPISPPGNYQVRLTAAGETQTQPFAVRRDPDLQDVTDADLMEQAKLAVEVRDKVSQANQAVIRIRHIKAQAKDRADKAKNARVTAAAEAMTTRADRGRRRDLSVSQPQQSGSAQLSDQAQ